MGIEHLRDYYAVAKLDKAPVDHKKQRAQNLWEKYHLKLKYKKRNYIEGGRNLDGLKDFIEKVPARPSDISEKTWEEARVFIKKRFEFESKEWGE